MNTDNPTAYDRLLFDVISIPRQESRDKLMGIHAGLIAFGIRGLLALGTPPERLIEVLPEEVLIAHIDILRLAEDLK